MALQIKGKVRLIIGAGNAKPGAAIGQAVSPLGVNMAEFCKDFNSRTSDLKADLPMRVQLTAFQDRSYNYDIKAPPTSHFLKKCAGVEKGASRPGDEIVGEVNLKQIYEIGKIKQKDNKYNNVPLEGMCRSIIASAATMGIRVVKE
eukprot:augustus_masked-scaffold_3-processed-gene-6.74-mRNA-1 protein AED:0.31 eAED:0.31 QI:0/-1/0/1/-1/1/1/0/145